MINEAQTKRLMELSVEISTLGGTIHGRSKVITFFEYMSPDTWEDGYKPPLRELADDYIRLASLYRRVADIVDQVIEEK